MTEIEVILKTVSTYKRKGFSTASCDGCFFAYSDQSCPKEDNNIKSCIKSSLTDGDKEIIFVELK